MMMRGQLKGQSLIEILVGTAVGALLVAVGAALVVPALQTNASLTQIQAQVQLGAEMADNVRAWSAGNWPGLLALATSSANPYFLNTCQSPFVPVGAMPTSGVLAASVLGESSFTANVATTTQSGMVAAYGLAYDSVNQRLFVADPSNNRVLVFSTTSCPPFPNGRNAIAVLGQASFASAAAATSQSGLYYPWGLAYDGVNQRLFVADWHNHRVMVFNVSTSTLAGTPMGEPATAVIGQSSFTTGSPGSGCTPGQFYYPTGLTYDSVSQRLFVADSNCNRVQVFSVPPGFVTLTSASGGLCSSWPSCAASMNQNGLNSPKGLSYDALAQRLFVADSGNNRVMVFAAAPGFASGENATAVIGQSGFGTGSVGSGQNGLTSPYDVSYDPPNQRLFVADAGNHRVMVFAAAPGFANGENAFAVIGETSFSDTGSGVTQSRFGSPADLAYDMTGARLFVGDISVARVMMFSAGTGIEPVTLGGTTYQRSFYLSDVYRDANGNPTSTVSGNFYDPSTKQVTVTVTSVSSSAPLVPYTFYLTRNTTNVFTQTNWSGGSGFTGPVTAASTTYYTQTNVNVNPSGALQLLGVPGGTCQS